MKWLYTTRMQLVSLLEIRMVSQSHKYKVYKTWNGFLFNLIIVSFTLHVSKRILLFNLQRNLEIHYFEHYAQQYNLLSVKKNIQRFRTIIFLNYTYTFYFKFCDAYLYSCLALKTIEFKTLFLTELVLLWLFTSIALHYVTYFNSIFLNINLFLYKIDKL